MEALSYMLIAVLLVASGAVLWSLYGSKVTAKAQAVKAAADAVKKDVGSL
jgi:hypothetical protein